MPFSILRFLNITADHFTGEGSETDYWLQEDHKAPYRQIGRRILAAALIGGWLLGLATKVHEAALSDVSAHGTDEADCVREGFWVIVAFMERR